MAPATEGKKVKNRVHLDVNTSRTVPREERRDYLDQEVQRLVTLGAQQVRVVDEPLGYPS